MGRDGHENGREDEGEERQRTRNRLKRIQFVDKVKRDKKEKKYQERTERKRAAKKLGADVIPPSKVQRTIENTKEIDPTVVEPGDTEVQEEVSLDEFASYFRGQTTPKMIITTNVGPTRHVIHVALCLSKIFVNATFYPRRKYKIQEIIKYAKHRDFTNLLVLNEFRKKTTDLILVHLPDGPTARFKILNLVMPKKIKNHAHNGGPPCELILNNFSTRLGLSVGRLLASMFSLTPAFRAHRVATFHVQRDFIFFRHHKYEFAEAETEFQKKKAPVVTRLQEVGPRFALKLMSLQRGTLDTQHGEFIFLFRKQLQTTRKRFFL
ncbi:ribosome production factor 1 [Pelomyxa schiedti]|nr:ribosome production factor 1 [Pelomyxa schiedti]